MITGMIAGLVTTDTLVMPQGTDWLIILAIGGISVVAQFFLTGAFVTTNGRSGSILAIRWCIY